MYRGKTLGTADKLNIVTYSFQLMIKRNLLNIKIF